jgi:hypothetical protein
MMRAPSDMAIMITVDRYHPSRSSFAHDRAAALPPRIRDDATSKCLTRGVQIGKTNAQSDTIVVDRGAAMRAGAMEQGTDGNCRIPSVRRGWLGRLSDGVIASLPVLVLVTVAVALLYLRIRLYLPY